MFQNHLLLNATQLTNKKRSDLDKIKHENKVNYHECKQQNASYARVNILFD